MRSTLIRNITFDGTTIHIDLECFSWSWRHFNFKRKKMSVFTKNTIDFYEDNSHKQISDDALLITLLTVTNCYLIGFRDGVKH